MKFYLRYLMISEKYKNLEPKSLRKAVDEISINWGNSYTKAVDNDDDIQVRRRQRLVWQKFFWRFQ